MPSPLKSAATMEVPAIPIAGCAWNAPRPSPKYTATSLPAVATSSLPSPLKSAIAMATAVPLPKLLGPRNVTGLCATAMPPSTSPHAVSVNIFRSFMVSFLLSDVQQCRKLSRDQQQIHFAIVIEIRRHHVAVRDWLRQCAHVLLRESPVAAIQEEHRGGRGDVRRPIAVQIRRQHR